MTARPAVRATKLLLPPFANSPTADAEITAVVDIGPTIRWRELPSAA